ncbi:MAG: ABC transporter permease [Candidatus Odinarchaeota archaeon]|nr:ABC transporter permease [Candidatus Odinarchaeota archaeon]
MEKDVIYEVTFKKRIKRFIRSMVDLWNLYKKERQGMVGLIIFLYFALIAIFAPYITDVDPSSTYAFMGPIFAAPDFFGFQLGTDNNGIPILSQLLWGARVSILVGFTATVMFIGIGTLIGLISGFFGGTTIDDVLMRLTDVFLVLPGLPLMITLAYILRPSIWNVILVIGLIGWPGTARLIRSQVLTVKERAYVDAARAAGASDSYIIIKHILPNVAPLAFANAVLGVGGSILSEAALSWLGLSDPVMPSWGKMLQLANVTTALSQGFWWVLLPPGAALTVIVLAFLYMGNAFDKILNPRLRAR